MKRYVCFILLFSLALSVFFSASSFAFAEGNEVRAVIATEEKQGDLLSVTLSLTRNDGLAAIGFRLEYDEDAFELLGSEFGGALSSLDPYDAFHDDEVTYRYPYVLYYSGYGYNRTDTGKLVTLSFRIKDSAVNGKKDFSLYVYDMAYYEGSAIRSSEYYKGSGSADALNGGVKVAEETYVVSGREAASAKGNVPLVIGLSVGGGAIVLLLLVISYIAYRKKNAKNLPSEKVSEEKKQA